MRRVQEKELSGRTGMWKRHVVKEEEKEDNGDTGETFVCWFSDAEKRVHAQEPVKNMLLNRTAGHLEGKMQNILENMTTEPTNKVPVKLLLRK